MSFYNVVARTAILAGDFIKPGVCSEESNVKRLSEKLPPSRFRGHKAANSLRNLQLSIARAQRFPVHTIAVQTLALAEVLRTEQRIHSHPIVVVFKSKKRCAVVAH